MSRGSLLRAALAALWCGVGSVGIDSAVAHSSAFSGGKLGCAASRGQGRRSDSCSVGRVQQPLRPRPLFFPRAPPPPTQPTRTANTHTANTQSQHTKPTHEANTQSNHTKPTLRAPSPGLFKATPALPPPHRHSETAPSCQVDSYFHQAVCDLNDDCVGITYQLTANVCW